MSFSPSLILDIAAIVLMAYCLYLVITLKKEIPGGVIGKKWKTLSVLVLIFAAGYMSMPFFGEIPPDTLRLIISVIFFFGSIYVLVTIKLIHTVIRSLSS